MDKKNIHSKKIVKKRGSFGCLIENKKNRIDGNSRCIIIYSFQSMNSITNFERCYCCCITFAAQHWYTFAQILYTYTQWLQFARWTLEKTIVISVYSFNHDFLLLFFMIYSISPYCCNFSFERSHENTFKINLYASKWPHLVEQIFTKRIPSSHTTQNNA